jgi:hypothetical protein
MEVRSDSDLQMQYAAVQQLQLQFCLQTAEEGAGRAPPHAKMRDDAALLVELFGATGLGGTAPIDGPRKIKVDVKEEKQSLAGLDDDDLFRQVRKSRWWSLLSLLG